jgi:hypothetical protein
MDIETKLWKRSNRSYETTIPHIALLNLDLPETDYKVIWKWSERARAWTVEFEEEVK